MKKNDHLHLHFILFTMLILSLSTAAHSAVTIENMNIVDVTPSGFSILWQTSEPSIPTISIFSDSHGTLEMTTNFEISAFPVHSGNPAITNEYESDLSKAFIQNQAKTKGMTKLSVSGCLPDTLYYFKIHSQAGQEMTTWPEGNPLEVITAGENAFISDAKQLKITLSNDSGNLDAAGWIISAHVQGMLSPVSEFVGDGVNANQACLNLSNFFNMDGNHWTPSTVKLIDLKIRIPGAEPLHRSTAIHFSENFFVSDRISLSLNIDDTEGSVFDKGDFNLDEFVNLEDSILGLKVITLYQSSVNLESEVDGDGKIGLKDTIRSIQKSGE